jgi:hypothetical protein
MDSYEIVFFAKDSYEIVGVFCTSRSTEQEFLLMNSIPTKILRSKGVFFGNNMREGDGHYSCVCCDQSLTISALSTE